MKPDCGLCKRYGHSCQFHPDKKGGTKNGPQEGLCGAKLKRKDGYCRHTAGWGTTHPGTGACRLHFGNAPSHKKLAQKRQAAEIVATYGLPREVEPQVALLEEIWRTAGHVDWLEGKVREYDGEDLVWGRTEETAGADGFGSKDAARPSVWLVLYRQERVHLVDVCRVAIAAGIAERQVKIAEEQGRLIAGVIRGVLQDLGVADRPQVAKVVRRHLMLVSDNKESK